MPTTWALIQYRDFWDVPRIYVTQHDGRWFLFDCPFDEETEDFLESYRVSLISPPDEETLTGSWKNLGNLATQFLGEIPIARVRFDSTKRKAIDAAILEELTAAIGVR